MKKKKKRTPQELKAYVWKAAQSLLPFEIRGKVGKIIVFKRYKGKTLITKYPDMSKVVLSEKQMEHRRRFRAAHLWAKRHLEEFKSLAKKEDMSPYRYGVREFFKRGLEVEDWEREMAAEQHQAREKEEQKEEKTPNVLMGLWLLGGKNERRIEDKSGINEGKITIQPCSHTRYNLLI